MKFRNSNQLKFMYKQIPVIKETTSILLVSNVIVDPIFIRVKFSCYPCKKRHLLCGLQDFVKRAPLGCLPNFSTKPRRGSNPDPSK